jgi:putrescine transport system substrate-binding protein
VIGDPAIYPTEDAVGNLYVVLPYGPREQRLVTRLWTRIKTGS